MLKKRPPKRPFPLLIVVHVLVDDPQWAALHNLVYDLDPTDLLFNHLGLHNLDARGIGLHWL